MPATSESMAMGGSSSMAGDKSDQGSNVKVVGLLGIGATLMLLGLTLLPTPYSSGFANYGPTVATSALFGGIVTIIAGFYALKKGHQFWGSAFAALGSFFLVWTITVPGHGGGAAGYGLAGFAFIYMLLSLTFLISARKHGWMTMFLFFFLWLSLVLWTVWFWMAAANNNISNGQMWATGAITILTGLIAWYMATAALTNWTYGKQYLPG